MPDAARIATSEVTTPDGLTDQPLRIALLGYRCNPFSGGQGVYIKNVAEGLATRGHEVHIIAGEPYPSLEPDSPVKLIRLPGLNLYDKTNPALALRLRHLRSFTDTFEWLSMMTGGFPEPYTFGRRVYAYLKETGKRYDIIHDNQTLSPGVLALQDLGLPLVTTIHHPITHDRDIAVAHAENWGLRLLIKRWHHFLRMQTRVTRKLQYIVTVSENSRNDIARAFGVDAQRISVVPNGINLDLFAPHNLNRESHTLITTASADQPLKGTQHLIPAFAELKQSFPDLELVFIGKPKPGGATESLIRAHGLNGSIRFVHGVSDTDIADLYSQATIAIVPSEYEGFGLPAAEAMACGVPVVAADGGALPEVVGDAGVVVPRGDSHQLAQAIAGLLHDPAERERLSILGRSRIEEHFSADRAARELEDYYRRVLTQ